MKIRRDAQPENGYTLIELLIVLALVGFIGAAITGGFQFQTQTWARSEDVISSAHRDAMSQAILRNVLSQAIPHRSDGLSSFHGQPDDVAFDGPPPAAFDFAGLSRIELALIPGDGGKRLMIKVSSLVDKRRSREAFLIDGLAGARFSYLDASEKAPVWLAYWRDRDRLPDAVRLEQSGTIRARSWPSFVVHLPIAQDAGCKFDPVSAECRKS